MSSFAPPRVIFGTSGLGNLFNEPTYSSKRETVAEVIKHSGDVAVFDSAGKYGAGLALECLGQSLKELGVSPSAVQVSNKLGWKRVPLTSPEPTFEPGAWVNLKNDAIQTISYDGIMECYHQGNELLGDYPARLVSIHDPDEYLAAAKDAYDREKRLNDILDGYRALNDLRQKGNVDSIGIGSKDPRIIDEISKLVTLDWAMFACSLTPYTHEPHVLELVGRLGREQVKILNSAVFNSGFLTGGNYYNYRLVTPQTDPILFKWREAFFALCKKHQADPAAVCVQFSFRFPETTSVALNTTSPSRVAGNIALATAHISDELWNDLKQEGLTAV